MLYHRSAIGPIEIIVGGMRGYGITMPVVMYPGEVALGWRTWHFSMFHEA